MSEKLKASGTCGTCARWIDGECAFKDEPQRKRGMTPWCAPWPKTPSDYWCNVWTKKGG